MANQLPERKPLPPALSNLQAMSVAFLAMPYLHPPTVPAQCVPWPFKSSSGSSGRVPSNPFIPKIARPVNKEDYRN